MFDVTCEVPERDPGLLNPSLGIKEMVERKMKESDLGTITVKSVPEGDLRYPLVTLVSGGKERTFFAAELIKAIQNCTNNSARGS